MAISPQIAALTRVIRPAPPEDSPQTVDVEGSSADVAALLGALAAHQPPVALGRWELGLLGETHAREVMERSGGGELTTKYAHYRPFGQHNGEVHLVLGWSAGEQVMDAVLECDPEYGKVKSLGKVSFWLENLVAEDDAVAAALRERAPALEAPSGADLPEVDKARFEEARRVPGDPKALEAGGHLFFSVADDGTAISVHKKGVRFLDAKGKRKAKNAKSTGKYGGIAPDGRSAWFLQEYGGLDFRVALPEGKPLVEYAVDAKGLAVLRDDCVVLRRPNELVLYRAEGEELVELDRVTSMELGGRGLVHSAFRGRGVVVSNETAACSWVFEVTGGKLAARWRLEGKVNDYPDVTAHVVDADEDTVLISTAWPKARIVAVPRS